MKSLQFLTTILLFLIITNITAQVGINNSNPHESAALDITSTTGGLLVPRMTETQRDAITSAATGLMIYQTDGTVGFYYYNGSSWEGYYSKNEVDTLIANLQSQFNNLASVGDFYQGGVVFYIFESGDTGYVAGETHGLIVAAQDQGSGIRIRWGNGPPFTTTGATATTIGTGSANTDAIIAAQGATETSHAAALARAYNGGGYTDWFLPSKDELNQMYTNKATINTTASAYGGSNFSTNYYYWSSTETVDNFEVAYGQRFYDGVLYYRVRKDFTGYVRAVRAF